MNSKSHIGLKIAGFVLVVGLIFAMDWGTLCPDLYWFDSAEFVNDAYLLDIPHPPGYPLFNLLAHLFLKIPAGSLGARVNLLSATSGSLAVGFFFLFLEAVGVPLALSFAAAALLGVSSQFWELSVVTEVYSLEALLLAICLWRLACNPSFARTEPDTAPSGDWILALTMGLALFHRPTTLFFIAPWFLMLYRRLAHPMRFVGIMALGSLPYLHTFSVFFFRTAPPGQLWTINYFDFPRNWNTFLRICTGTLYAGNLMILPPAEMAHEISGYLWLCRDQFGAIVVSLGLFGVVRAFQRRFDRIDLFLVAIFWGNVLFFLHYNALEKDTMYVPSFVALLALAIRTLVRVFENPPDIKDPANAPPPSLAYPRAMPVVALLLALWAVRVEVENRPEVDKHDYFTVKKCVDNTARLIDPGGYLYLTDDLIIHPFFFARITRNLRPDVSLRIVDKFNTEVEEGLNKCLREGKSVYSPLFFPEEEYQQVKARFRLIPRGFLYQILPKGQMPPALPPQHGLEGKFGSVSIEGGTIFPRRHPEMEPSDQIQVVLTWNGPTRDKAVVFRWERLGLPPVSWVFPIGYQERPVEGSRLTEEYLLTIPREKELSPQGPGRLEVTIQEGIAAALKAGHLRVVSSRVWRPQEAFFKGREGSFVECMERGWPAFYPVLELVESSPPLTGAWVELGPLNVH